MKIIWKGAATGNFEIGRKFPIDRIVLHWIVGRLTAADVEFQKPSRQASAHYGVGNKVVHQYVKEEDTAYHCGNLAFNRRSIGIEHEGGPDIPITDETYATSAEILANLCKKYVIPLARTHIVGHREVSATQCPGVLDIDRIIREAEALAVPPTESPELISCKAQVAREIKSKEETFQELQETRQQRDGLDTQVKALQTDLKAIGDLLGVSPDPNLIQGKVSELVSLEDNLREANKQASEWQQKYETLEKSVEPMTVEMGELRRDKDIRISEMTRLNSMLDKCELSQTLKIKLRLGKIFICTIM